MPQQFPFLIILIVVFILYILGSCIRILREYFEAAPRLPAGLASFLQDRRAAH